MIMFLSGKNLLVIFILLILLFFGCDNHKKRIQYSKVDTVFKKTNTKSLSKNNIDASDMKFDLFFNRFNSDRNFQLSRIQFPLRVWSGTGNGQSIKFMKKNEWTYTNFTQIKKILIEEKNKAKNEMDLMISITDTGVQVEYHFKIKNDQWWLYGITDKSD